MQPTVVNAQHCIASCCFSANIYFVVTIFDGIYLDFIHSNADAGGTIEMDFMGFIA